MADKAHILTDEKLAQMEKRLSAIYSEDQRDIQAKLLDFAESVENESTQLLDAIKQSTTREEEKAAKDAYLRFFKGVVKTKTFKDLSAEIALDLFNTNTKASAYINSQTPEIYALNYNWINDELSKDIPDFVSQTITSKEADKYGDLTKQTVSKSKDTKWNEGNIKKSVIVGASLYLGANAIAKRSAKIVAKKNHNSASMHSEGMGTDAENKARLDGMYRAEDMGNELTKFWMATLDNRTRDSHAMLDGVSVPLNDTFDNGLERPRDPNGAPAEICNCRCTMTYGVGQAKGKTRSSRLGNVSGSYKKSSSFKNTQSEEIANMTYREWMKWHKNQ